MGIYREGEPISGIEKKVNQIGLEDEFAERNRKKILEFIESMGFNNDPKSPDIDSDDISWEDHPDNVTTIRYIGKNETGVEIEISFRHRLKNPAKEDRA